MIKTIALFLSIFWATSCTLGMWAFHGYDEEIAGFFVEKKSQSLVGIGKKYHYIFKVEKALADILAADKHYRFKPHFFDFAVDENNHIAGDLYLTAKQDDLTTSERVFFQTHHAYHDGLEITAKVRIQGMRYAIQEAFKKAIHFDQPYQLRIREPLDNRQIAKNIVMTPVTLIGDAGLILLALPAGVLYGVLSPFD